MSVPVSLRLSLSLSLALSIAQFLLPCLVVSYLIISHHISSYLIISHHIYLSIYLSTYLPTYSLQNLYAALPFDRFLALMTTLKNSKRMWVKVLTLVWELQHLGIKHKLSESTTAEYQTVSKDIHSASRVTSNIFKHDNDWQLYRHAPNNAPMFCHGCGTIWKWTWHVWPSAQCPPFEESILNDFEKEPAGVYVKASTLGSLEALLSFLQDMKIPVFDVGIGEVHKRDVKKACIMKDRSRQILMGWQFSPRTSSTTCRTSSQSTWRSSENHRRLSPKKWLCSLWCYRLTNSTFSGSRIQSF